MPGTQVGIDSVAPIAASTCDIQDALRTAVTRDRRAVNDLLVSLYATLCARVRGCMVACTRATTDSLSPIASRHHRRRHRDRSRSRRQSSPTTAAEEVVPAATQQAPPTPSSSARGVFVPGGADDGPSGGYRISTSYAPEMFSDGNAGTDTMLPSFTATTAGASPARTSFAAIEATLDDVLSEWRVALVTAFTPATDALPTVLPPPPPQQQTSMTTPPAVTTSPLAPAGHSPPATSQSAPELRPDDAPLFQTLNVNSADSSCYDESPCASLQPAAAGVPAFSQFRSDAAPSSSNGESGRGEVPCALGGVAGRRGTMAPSILQFPNGSGSSTSGMPPVGSGPQEGGGASSSAKHPATGGSQLVTLPPMIETLTSELEALCHVCLSLAEASAVAAAVASRGTACMSRGTGQHGSGAHLSGLLDASTSSPSSSTRGAGRAACHLSNLSEGGATSGRSSNTNNVSRLGVAAPLQPTSAPGLPLPPPGPTPHGPSSASLLHPSPMVWTSSGGTRSFHHPSFIQTVDSSSGRGGFSHPQHQHQQHRHPSSAHLLMTPPPMNGLPSAPDQPFTPRGGAGGDRHGLMTGPGESLSAPTLHQQFLAQQQLLDQNVHHHQNGAAAGVFNGGKSQIHFDATPNPVPLPAAQTLLHPPPPHFSMGFPQLSASATPGGLTPFGSQHPHQQQQQFQDLVAGGGEPALVASEDRRRSSGATDSGCATAAAYDVSSGIAIMPSPAPHSSPRSRVGDLRRLRSAHRMALAASAGSLAGLAALSSTGLSGYAVAGAAGALSPPPGTVGTLGSGRLAVSDGASNASSPHASGRVDFPPPTATASAESVRAQQHVLGHKPQQLSQLHSRDGGDAEHLGADLEQAAGIGIGGVLQSFTYNDTARTPSPSPTHNPTTAPHGIAINNGGALLPPLSSVGSPPSLPPPPPPHAADQRIRTSSVASATLGNNSFLAGSGLPPPTGPQTMTSAFSGTVATPPVGPSVAMAGVSFTGSVMAGALNSLAGPHGLGLVSTSISGAPPGWGASVCSPAGTALPHSGLLPRFPEALVPLAAAPAGLNGLMLMKGEGSSHPVSPAAAIDLAPPLRPPAPAALSAAAIQLPRPSSAGRGVHRLASTATEVSPTAGTAPATAAAAMGLVVPTLPFASSSSPSPQKNGAEDATAVSSAPLTKLHKRSGSKRHSRTLTDASAGGAAPAAELHHRGDSGGVSPVAHVEGGLLHDETTVAVDDDDTAALESTLRSQRGCELTASSTRRDRKDSNTTRAVEKSERRLRRERSSRKEKTNDSHPRHASTHQAVHPSDASPLDQAHSIDSCDDSPSRDTPGSAHLREQANSSHHATSHAGTPTVPAPPVRRIVVAPLASYDVGRLDVGAREGGGVVVMSVARPGSANSASMSRVPTNADLLPVHAATHGAGPAVAGGDLAGPPPLSGSFALPADAISSSPTASGAAGAALVRRSRQMAAAAAAAAPTSATTATAPMLAFDAGDAGEVSCKTTGSATTIGALLQASSSTRQTGSPDFALFQSGVVRDSIMMNSATVGLSVSTKQTLRAPVERALEGGLDASECAGFALEAGGFTL